MISEFPLMVFTVLTGLAAGGYVGAALFPKTGEDAKPWLFPLVAVILVAVGGLAAMGHLGRPAMMLNVLNNPTSSLTLEGMTAGLLAVIAIVDLVICFTKKRANRAVRIVGAIAGILCLCVVTSAYATSYGNAAWIATPTLPLFVVGGIAAGGALWMLFADQPNENAALTVAIANVLLALVLVWQAMTFSGLGAVGAGFIGGGAVIALVAAVVAFMGRAGKIAPATAAALTCVLAVVALIVSRYGFYMASII